MLCEMARSLQLAEKLNAVAELAPNIILKFRDDATMPQQQ